MKAFLAIAALVFMQLANAEHTTQLREGDLGLYDVTARVVSVKEACPADSHVRCVRGGSEVTLEIPLQGCLDRLGGYSTHFSFKDGTPTLDFSGVAIATEASTTARCIKAPSTQVRIQIPFTGNVELVNMTSIDKTHQLHSKDLGLSQANARIISVSRLCPVIPGRIRCQAIGSVVEVEVMLRGCRDRLGSYSYATDYVDGKGVIKFAAVNVATEASTYTRCAKAPTETVKVVVPFYEPIELVNLDFVVR